MRGMGRARKDLRGRKVLASEYIELEQSGHSAV